MSLEGIYQNCHERTVCKSMNIKESADKGTGGNKEHVTKNWRKEDSCYLASENIAELLPRVIWKEEIINWTFS